tara:strand:+ start:357 stop:545 length:189 start_codon:yes stop_codon:yes gene_type:complete
MLEFCKSVLQKVSFDHLLFQKELNKSIDWLGKSEVENLRLWCMETYGTQHGLIIQQAFETIL